MATPYLTHALAMQPAGSLNSLRVNGLLLDPSDPLATMTTLCGKDLVSRRALIQILKDFQHPAADDLRAFLDDFNSDSAQDQAILARFAQRFSVIINSARTASAWPAQDRFSQSLSQHWQSITTLVLSGGLTSAEFGLALAETVEQQCGELAVINSPWGGTTALFGLAQTVARSDDILVMDFGGTGIKRAVAHRYGNRMTMLPETATGPYCVNGLMRRDGFLRALKHTRALLKSPLPVAISLACYLDKGHPYRYFSGIYHRLADDSEHLATDLDQRWLPEADLGPLLLLEHDSTAAALAFRFRDPAMMVTLGTGLGSARCPSIKF